MVAMLKDTRMVTMLLLLLSARMLVHAVQMDILTIHPDTQEFQPQVHASVHVDCKKFVCNRQKEKWINHTREHIFISISLELFV